MASGADNAAEYWCQHAALKSKYLDDVEKVHRAFKKYVDHMRDQNDSDQKKKLRFLLSYVELCATVLSEDESTHQPRTVEELNKVVKYIVKIVNPYLKKLRTEVDRLSLIAQHGTPTLSFPHHETTQQNDCNDEETEYWRQHASLKSKHHENVEKVNCAFQKYVDHMRSQSDSDYLQKLQYLQSCVQLCASVLSEDESMDQPRTLEELHKVHKYIVKIVNPYLRKLRDEAERRSPSYPQQRTMHGNRSTDGETDYSDFSEYSSC